MSNENENNSLLLMMLSACHELYGNDDRYNITVHFKVGGGLYCTLSDSSCVSDIFLLKLFAKMKEMQQADYPVIKESIRTQDAISMFHELGMHDKERLLHYRLVANTNISSLHHYKDYLYGNQAESTGCLKDFCLIPYNEGFVLCYRSIEDTSVQEQFHPDEKLFQIQNQSLEWGRKIGILEVSDLNERIVKGGMQELLLIQEAYHEKQIAQIAQNIADCPAKRIILIAGPSSSGKTTFSHRLSVQLASFGIVPHPIPVDDYFVNREDTPKDEDGNYDFECLEALDLKQFNDDIAALLEGRDVELPTYNFKTGKREYKGKHLQIGKNDVLVIEGIHCLNRKLTYAFSDDLCYRVYISALTQLNIDAHNRIATTDGRLIRRMVRDARTRGTSAESTIAMWPSVRRGEENHIFPNQETADVMFNSALIYELAVLKVYADPLLFGITSDSPYYSEARRLLKFMDYFVPMPSDYVPQNSLLREFIGGGCFDV